MAGEQGLINPLPAVAPAFFDALGGAIGLIAHLGEAFGQFLLLPRFGVNNKPG